MTVAMPATMSGRRRRRGDAATAVAASGGEASGAVDGAGEATAVGGAVAPVGDEGASRVGAY